MMIVTKFLPSCCHPATVDENPSSIVASLGEFDTGLLLQGVCPLPKPRSDRVFSPALWTRQTAATCAKRQPAHICAWSGRGRRGAPAPSYVPNFTAYGATCLKYEGDFACRANNQNPPTTVPIPPDRMEPSSIKPCARPAPVKARGQKRPLPKLRARRKSIGLITRPRS